ncbi:MAG: ATP-grasp domain-containing protein [Asgard group archaeon]|nr:ATP-grasp domain-containing protein [Asgard group archaeon]
MPKILIVDYLTGGGFAEEEFPTDQLAEGYALLRAEIEDFAMAGYTISTLIDQRLMEHIRISPIHEFQSVASHEDFINGLNEFADKVDYILPIAPESKGILKDLSTMLQNSDSEYLGSSPEGVELAQDKLRTLELAQELGLNVPATLDFKYDIPYDQIVSKIDFLGYPLIIKPNDSAGCQGLTKITSEDELQYSFKAAHAVSNSEKVLVQEFIKGTPISTSLIANEENVLPISINRQNLRLLSKQQSGNYVGGEVPFSVQEHNKEVLNVSQTLVEQMGLKGFVGVDFIVNKNEIFIMEVNPRVTVPFVAINNISNKRIADTLIPFIEGDLSPPKLNLNRFASFSKIAVPSSIFSKNRFEKIALIDGVQTPPFPIGNGTLSHAFLIGLGSSITSARKSYQQVKNEVLKILSS